MALVESPTVAIVILTSVLASDNAPLEVAFLPAFVGTVAVYLDESCALMYAATAVAICSGVASLVFTSTVGVLPAPPLDEYAVPPALAVFVNDIKSN